MLMRESHIMQCVGIGQECLHSIVLPLLCSLITSFHSTSVPVLSVNSMAFTGKYQLESRENYDEFIAKTGLKKAEPGVKVVTEVVQDGDNFSWKHGMPGWSWNAKFTLGEECDMKSMGGVPFKGTVTMNDGKLCLQFPEYSFTGEMIDDKLVTYCKTTGEDGVTLKTVSARI